MSVFGTMCDDYEIQLNILNIKIKYLESLLDKCDVAIIDDYPSVLEYVWVADDTPIVSDPGVYLEEYYEKKLSGGYFGTVDRILYKKVKQDELYRSYQMMPRDFQLHKYNMPPSTITVIRDVYCPIEYIIIASLR